MDVKPWEPVKYGWAGFYANRDWYWDVIDEMSGWTLFVTLANGQRIIVSALSEDRKAARKARHTEIMRSVS